MSASSRFLVLLAILSSALLPVLSGVAWLSAAGAPPRPHVVVVVVDALRRDHVGAYGYTRTTTVNLDTRVAAAGARLNGVTTSPWTCPSNAALLTGRYPSTIGTTWATRQNSLPEDEYALAEILHDEGYYTVGFVARVWCVRASYGFDQGFDLYDDGFCPGCPTDGQPAPELNARLFDWLDNTYGSVISGTQPLFLFAYYWDPHTYYDPPPPYDLLYDPGYTGTVTAELFAHGESARDGSLILTARDLQHVRALYDGEITFWDAQFGLLLDKLEQLGILENALLVVTTDHGEMFGEHGEFAHGGSVYAEVSQVPLLLRYPGVITPGLAPPDEVQSFDLLPTILDYVELPIPVAVEALSLRPLLAGQPLTRPVFTEVDLIRDPTDPLLWTSPVDDLRAVRAGSWRYIEHLNSAAADELYTLQPTAPYERENVLLQEPERASVMRGLVFQRFFPRAHFLPALMDR